MIPELADRRGLQLDEKVALTVALVLGLPLVLLLFWARGFFPWLDFGKPQPHGDAKSPNAVIGTAPAGLPRPKTSDRVGVAPGAGWVENGSSSLLLAKSEPGRTGSGEGRMEKMGMGTGAALAEVRKTQPKQDEGKAGAGGPPGDPAMEQERDRLREENRSLVRESEDLRREFAGAKMLYAKLVADSQARDQQLNEIIRKLQAEQDRLRSEGGTLRADLDRLQNESASLRKQEEDSKKLQLALDAERKKNRELDEVSKRNQAELQALKARLEAADAQARKPGGEESPEALRAAKTALQAQVEDLRRKLEEAAKAKPSGMAAAGTPDLAEKERIRALEAEIQRLQAQLKAAPNGKAPVKAKVIERAMEKPKPEKPAAEKSHLPAEVRKSGDLWEGAVPLHQFLRKAADDKMGIPDRDAAAQTGNLGRLIARVKFAKGRSQLSAKEEARLESLFSQPIEQGYFLVVGYASLPGCPKQNEDLSRRRAEKVSAVVKKRLKAETRLQVMYFGETDQFDSKREEENQVVEIWSVAS